MIRISFPLRVFVVPLVPIAFICAVLPAAEIQSPPPVGTGKLSSLSVHPEKIVLIGSDAVQQLIVTGHFGNGGVADVTESAAYRVKDEKIASVDPSGVLTPVGNGTTEVTIDVEGQSVAAEISVTGADVDRPINFANEIVPVLTKLGCNAGACHGKAEGKNGFKLSLLGFDPAADYEALVHEGRGRRVLESAPEHSLLLMKPTGRLGHGGGKPLVVDSPEYKLIARWIGSGLPYGNDDDPQVVGIDVMPAHRLLAKEAKQQIAVAARFSDGSIRDVTRGAEYKSNDAELVDVSPAGVVETLDRFGEGSIMIRYLGHVAVFRATIPLNSDREDAEKVPANNFIDELVAAKHRQLGFVPSELCTDGEFLRRASLDIIGTLPTPEEVKSFTAEKSSDKREKLVDALLKRSEYGAYWTLLWADILRVRGGSNDNPKTKMEGLNTRAVKFHDWIRQSLSENKPYDQFVREIITADGVTTGPRTKPPILWYLELKNAEGLVEDTAQAFLGTRIQCARCHHHPFERWSQDDYWHLAGFFARVQWQTGIDKNGKPVKERKPVRVSESARIGQVVAFNPEGQLTDSRGKVYTSVQALSADPVVLSKDDDPRDKLVDWMVQPDNPFFARALVNRYWGHFFGRGIVDAVDDLRETNPPSNPQLLDALAKDFVQHRFDLKHLVRTICTSRAYQRSSRPNETNRDDVKHGSHFLPRRLAAEVLFDAIDQVTGSKTKFRVAGEKEKVELEIRAIERPHMRVSNYFLEVFGINHRDSACECGRESNVTLAQRAHMLNGGEIRAKLSKRAEALAGDKRPDDEKIDEAYLTFFARTPTDEERDTVSSYLTMHGKDEESKQEAYYDLLWALINSKEFAFQH